MKKLIEKISLTDEEKQYLAAMKERIEYLKTEIELFMYHQQRNKIMSEFYNNDKVTKTSDVKI